MENKYCGFVAIVGRPNVGKSTLMNHLIGQKLSITSRKPQTTQHKIHGVLTDDNYQFIFVDTPGFQKRYINKLNSLLNQSVIKVLNDVNIILLVIEAGEFNLADEDVIKLLPTNAQVVLIINKQDKLKDKVELNRFVKDIRAKFNFSNVVIVSAKHHFGIDSVITIIKPYLPSSEFLYDSHELTNRSSSFLAKEIVREKLFRYLGRELPYSVAVEVDEFKQKELLHISITILVDKTSQKGIVIGKSGEKLKKIATDARIDMEKIFNSQVFLKLWVKVRSGFADDIKFLKEFE